ncbi:transmembrane BAX inhibitor motif containing 1a isoform X1 [Entelurus aequoreus]|uniref:transmembrane BAX inhibitor motif containing 1a isoform X1 n=1 Tax=Entelurus aequoreus TaxID=161455 RepID=UPI002B1E119F|nr:transmembrane BAX inhibitor motif containing 1a isoform X1 [Entelurus aequoreus]
MSRSDYPPGYDEAHGPMYAPQGGNYPAAPAYGFPAYGGPPPGQPVAPYPTGSNAPLFSGQPGNYPPGNYPPGNYPQGNYPQGNYPPGSYPPGPQGAGYPSQPPMPPIMPITMPSDVMSSDDEHEFAARGADWDDVSIRHAFIRKVYMILASQLLFTTAIVAVFTFVEPVRYFVQRNQAIYWASYGVYFVTHLVLVCCKGPRRKFPWNLILLFIFTLALSYMTGSISSFYDTKAVFLALAITAVVCIAVTVFCFQTKVDFTKCRGFFCVLGIVVFVTGIISVIVLSFKYIYWLHMLYAAIGAIAFTLFLAYHTQLLIGNRKYSISPEEYVFGALSLYVDIVQIFLFLLQIIGSSK